MALVRFGPRFFELLSARYSAFRNGQSEWIQMRMQEWYTPTTVLEVTATIGLGVTKGESPEGSTMTITESEDSE